MLTTFERHLHPDDQEKTWAAVNRHLDNDEPYDVEYRLRTRDGEYRWYRARGAAVRDESGAAVRMAGSIQDITEQKRFEQQLAQQAEALEKANAELKRSNEELDSFAYIASHDLKEPLRGLHNYASFLKEDYGEKIEAEGQEWLDALMRLTGRMEDLINSLLYYSRVGRTELAVEQVDLNDMLKHVLERLRATLAERGVEVRVPRPLPTMWCDRVRVREVFANLIANASKYNDKPCKWVEVGYIEPQHVAGAAVTGDEDPDRPPIFYVRDNGIGIPESRREQVFEMFRRLHGRDKFGGGTGAGLTIVKKIVNRHGGRIWIESEEGEGTTFYFTLAAS
jgi:light-regulated signal transduction histidine kinase (bacteriophytochrome)